MKKVTARKTSAATKYIHEEVNKEKVNLTDGSDFGAMVSLRASNSLQVAAAKKKEADWQRQSSQQLPRGRARNPSSDCIPEDSLSDSDSDTPPLVPRRKKPRKKPRVPPEQHTIVMETIAQSESSSSSSTPRKASSTTSSSSWSDSSSS